MAEILKPDLCIIGASALGIALARQARSRGLEVVLVDRGIDEEGDQPRGALQRAAFAASAARIHAIRRAARLGIEVDTPKPNYRMISEQAAARAAAMAPMESAVRLTALGISVKTGEPRFVDKRTLGIGDERIRASHFVLATGASPVVPDLPGLDQVAFFTPDSILENIRKLTHLVVIGGDATALELAQAYGRLGSAVTLVPQGPLLAGFDPEPVAILLRHLREEGVEVLEGASVTAINPRGQGTGIALQLADGSEAALDVSHILVSLGRQPMVDAAMLVAAQVRADPARPGHIRVGAAGQTSNFRISAFGGAAGQYHAPLAMAGAQAWLDGVLGQRIKPIRAGQVPLAVATEPPLVQIGVVAGQVRAGQRVLRASTVESGAAQANADPVGAIKIVTNAKGAILGGAMVGQGAGDVVALLAMAMQRGVPAAELARLPLPTPSAASVLQALGEQAASTAQPGKLARRKLALLRLLP